MTVGVVLLAAGILYVAFIHQILSAERRVPAQALVIEAWIPDPAFSEALEEANRPEYRAVFVVGKPTDVNDRFASGTAGLKVESVGPPRVVRVPADENPRGSTLSFAIAVREAIAGGGHDVQAVNVFTIGPHARKSHIVFRRALDPLEVGVLSAAPVDYQPRRWWLSWSGWQWVLLDTIKTVRAAVVGY